MARMSGHSMAELRYHLSCFGEGTGSEWLKPVSMYCMTGKRAHARTKLHELDAVFVVPPNHFDNVTDVCQANLLYKHLSQGDIWFLASVWPIRSLVFRLRRIPEGMAVIDD